MPVPNIVRLDNVRHADLCVAQGYGAAFGDDINAVRIFPNEFEAVQREYAILFRIDENQVVQAFALLGLDRDENLYVSGGEWRARYIPALQRRGPFSIVLRRDDGADGGESATINVDLNHPRIVVDGGERVFKSHGGSTPYLDGVNEALSCILEGARTSDGVMARWSALGLIEAVDIDIVVAEQTRYDLNRFMAVQPATLDRLTDATLLELHRRSWLAMAYAAAASLANIGHLVELKNIKAGLR